MIYFTISNFFITINSVIMKNKTVTFLLVIIFLLVSYIFFKEKIQKKITSNQNSSISIIKPIEPGYSVMINKAPALIYDLQKSWIYSYEAIIKNISVKPFITNFEFGECNFKDEKNNKYTGTLIDNNMFEKAIFPNESRTFSAKDINIGIIRGLPYSDKGFKKCSYNNKGDYVCEFLKNIKITDCTGIISTDGKNFNKVNSIKVIFP